MDTLLEPLESKDATLPAPEQLLALDNQLCFALYSASLAMTKLYKPLLVRLDLTYPQYLVMLVLWERDAMTVSELGARLCLDSGTLTPMLKRLEAAALLERVRDAGDERRVVVSLTPGGAALKQRALEVPPQVLCATGCSLAEVMQMRSMLQDLRDNILAHTNS